MLPSVMVIEGLSFAEFYVANLALVRKALAAILFVLDSRSLLLSVLNSNVLVEVLLLVVLALTLWAFVIVLALFRYVALQRI